MTEVLTAARRRPRLGAYALWQLRDYMLEKGIGTAIVMLFAGALFYLGIRDQGAVPPQGRRVLIENAFTQLISNLALLGALFATNGIVSEDRKQGYYRFLFAKPVNVPRFYAQKFAVHMAGFLFVAAALLVAFNVAFGRLIGAGALPFASRWMAVVVILAGLVFAGMRSPGGWSRARLTRFAERLATFLLTAIVVLLVVNLALAFASADKPLPFLPGRFFLTLAAGFVALGGIGFLMSVLWRFDWLSFMVVYIVSSVAWVLFGESDSWRGMLVRLLPPVNRLDGIYRAVVFDTSLPLRDLVWLTAYGLGCFVLGLIALRRRPLAVS